MQNRSSRPLRQALSLIALATLAPIGQAAAAPCDSVQKYAGKISAAVQKVCSYDQNGKITACDKVGSVANEIQYWADWWNSMAGNSWAHIGPRAIGYTKTDYGTLRVPGKRLWVSTGPAKGAVQFTVKHLEGQGGFKANVCTIDAKGGTHKVHVEEIRPEDGNKSRTFRISAAEADGRFVAVDMLSIQKRFKYSIELGGSPTTPGPLGASAGGNSAGGTPGSTNAVQAGQLIALRTAHGQYVIGRDTGALDANAARKSAWERFVLGGTPTYGQQITLRSHHGKYVVAEPDGNANANRDAAGAWEHWSLQSADRKTGALRCGDRIFLRGAHGKFLVAESDGKANANRPGAQAWETFTVECN